MEPYGLSYYTMKVASYSTAQLRHVIQEINSILPNFEAEPERHGVYIRKLYAELDACRTELQRRK